MTACEALADVRWNAFDEAGQRGGDGHKKPENHGDDEASDGDGLQRDHDGLLVQQMNGETAGDVSEVLHATHDDRHQQKRDDRQRADGDKEDVDGAGQTLTAAAIGTVGEMLLVVGAHLGRDAGDVVPPAGEDGSDDGIRAGSCIERTRVVAQDIPSSPVSFRLRGYHTLWPRFPAGSPSLRIGNSTHGILQPRCVNTTVSESLL
jgi:hypothetical protein